jgi:hypothetical protein
MNFELFRRQFVNLCFALVDDLVKIPEVAYHKNLNSPQVDKAQLACMKLDDAITLHEEMRTHLRTSNAQTSHAPIKPFVFVVAANIEHAKSLHFAQQKSTRFPRLIRLATPLLLHARTLTA